MIGSAVLVRQHEGKRHEVIAVPGGFLWEGHTFPDDAGHPMSPTYASKKGTRYR